MCDSASFDGGFTGGAGGPSYSTLLNTPGMGDPVAPGSDGPFGSGDYFGGLYAPVSRQRRAPKASERRDGKPRQTKTDGGASSFREFGCGSVTTGGLDLSPRPTLVPWSGK